jgi:hypothetical protein
VHGVFERVRDGVNLEITLSNQSGTPLLLPYCVSPDVKKIQQYLVLIKYVQDNPAQAHLPTATLFGRAMKAAFPCPLFCTKLSNQLSTSILGKRTDAPILTLGMGFSSCFANSYTCRLLIFNKAAVSDAVKISMLFTPWVRPKIHFSALSENLGKCAFYAVF